MNFTNTGQFKRTHGMSLTRTYKSWVMMKHRCNRATASYYQHYGGRGIKVCERWQTFENFYIDMGERPIGKTLDRINTNGDYEPSNCRWATASEQAISRRVEVFEIDGIVATLTEHAERAGIPRPLAACRLTRGWDTKDLLLRPQKKGASHVVHFR